MSAEHHMDEPIVAMNPDMGAWACSSHLATPHFAVRLDLLRANLTRVSDLAARHSVSLRPHVKTHKCIEIARMQIEGGASGITASKPGEAMVFIGARMPAVTVAYPVLSQASASALIKAAGAMGCDLRFVIDSSQGLQTLFSVAPGGRKVAAYLDHPSRLAQQVPPAAHHRHLSECELGACRERETGSTSSPT